METATQNRVEAALGNGRNGKSPKVTPVLIEVPELRFGELEITLVGLTPLVVHRFEEKARKQMLDKQMGKPKGPREKKDPWRDFCGSLYWLTRQPAKPTQADIKKARFGIPVLAFKAAAVDAALDAQLKKTEVRRAFRVWGDHMVDGKQYAEIKGKPEIREDIVRLSGPGAVPDIRFRGEFWPWRVTFRVEYMLNTLTPAQIVNLFNRGGFSIGVGEHRPERGGEWGMFKVASKGEL